jgi:hypothetical protein
MFLGAHLPLEERFNISKSALEDLASLQRKRKLQAPPYQIVLELPPELSAQRKAITQARSMLFVELAKSHPLSQEALLFARDGPGPDGALQRTLQLVEPFLLEAGHVAGCGGWGLCTLANVTVARGRVLAIYWCVHAARCRPAHSHIALAGATTALAMSWTRFRRGSCGSRHGSRGRCSARGSDPLWC